jgi:UDP-glucose 4-epimerase
LHGKSLLIGGDDSFALLQGEVQDDVMDALGVGRLGAAAGLPGDPNDDRGWGLTDWFDTREAQQLLEFQQHTWSETVQWLADAQGPRRTALRALRPILLPLMRAFFIGQKRWERRDAYANPWRLITQKYGPDILAPTSF